MNYVERMVDRGRREGELKGLLLTIRRFLGCDVPWSTIEAATGIDEDKFRRIEQRFDPGMDAVAPHVEYLLAVLPKERRRVFVAALRRNVPGRGGEVMNYVDRMVDRGRREGELIGRVQAVRGLLGCDVPWSTIEAATGIDETTFRRLDQQFDDNGAAE